MRSGRGMLVAEADFSGVEGVFGKRCRNSRTLSTIERVRLGRRPSGPTSSSGGGRVGLGSVRADCSGNEMASIVGLANNEEHCVDVTDVTSHESGLEISESLFTGVTMSFECRLLISDLVLAILFLDSPDNRSRSP
jgi:hypothetical protein